MTDITTLKALEFDKILEILSGFAVSRVSKDAISNITPSYDAAEAEELLEQVAEAYITVEKYGLSPVSSFDDVTAVLAKSKIDAALQPSELLAVARLIRCARAAKRGIEGTGDDVMRLKTLAASIFADAALEKAINECIAGENEIRDDASAALRDIRRKIRAADARLKERLASYTRSNEMSKYMRDNLVTVRDGRFVLPVRSECQSSVPGLIHDKSATGSTVFIEPFAVVQLNNELKSLRIEESREIDRILRALSQMTANAADNLAMCQETCTMLDIIYAKSAFSVYFDCSKPLLNTKGYVNLIDARHPLIDKNKVVPVTVAFGRDYRLLLITGPNTGGKTVCLKTVGLFCLMAASGINIPCAPGSSAAVFDGVYCDVGDGQSVLNSLSTFSAHIANIIGITAKITDNSLVLLDELGGGTDPAEGAALAVGVIKFLERTGARGIVTTHYGKLKEYAALSPALMNACMRFDEKTLTPSYKLVTGLAGVSRALKIAENLGLDGRIIDEAQKSLDGETTRFSDALGDAERIKSEALDELERVSALRTELEKERAALLESKKAVDARLEKIRANAALELKKIVSAGAEKAAQIIDEMRSLAADGGERARFEAMRLKKELDGICPESENDDLPTLYAELKKDGIAVGQRVIIRALGTDAEVKTLPDKRGELYVLSGNASVKVKLDALAAAPPRKVPQKKERFAVQSPPAEPAPKTEEINVIGLTVAEAVEVLAPHIETAENGAAMRIVHGKGTGALGRGLQAYLKKHPRARSVRWGGYGEGGSGVTILEIN
ncbi:MAG: endonuclease MutS2 [Clostridiales bacterium]|jgi:DNA mismatch repair protein MutS2|nr:endonuclease MutS2 [Clostridiales bacterium]